MMEAPPATDEAADEDPFAGAGGPGSDALTELEEKFNAQVAERQASEDALTKKNREDAERALDEFYDAQTDKRAQKQASNRDKEEELQAGLAKPTPSNPFEKVVELIGGATDDGEGKVDLSIMRSLLVRLKNDPKQSGKHASSPAEKAAVAADPVLADEA